MSSSESEDDCYSNVAQKLQKMKNTYKEDKVDMDNLLNETSELDKLVKDAEISAKLEPEPEPVSLEDIITTSVADNSIEMTAETSAMSTRRVTRSSKNKATPAPAALPAKRPRRGRGKKSNADSGNVPLNTNTEATVARTITEATASVASVSESSTSVNEAFNSIAAWLAGRRTPRRGRGRRRAPPPRPPAPTSPMYPIYSIGNTCDYPDQSECQELFSSKPKPAEDVLVIEDQDQDQDVNEELSVKVYWQNSEYFKFSIRKFQKIIKIFEYFAKKENVSQNNLLFTYNDRILSPDNTPDSIDYQIVKFIDGGIVNKNITELTKNHAQENTSNGIKIKFQFQNSKKPFETTLGVNDKLQIAMLKCAERFEQSLDKLRFVFDGDSVSARSTPAELEFEGGECIDVKIVS